MREIVKRYPSISFAVTVHSELLHHAYSVDLQVGSWQSPNRVIPFYLVKSAV
jgi:hypothetical protein